MVMSSIALYAMNISVGHFRYHHKISYLKTNNMNEYKNILHANLYKLNTFKYLYTCKIINSIRSKLCITQQPLTITILI